MNDRDRERLLVALWTLGEALPGIEAAVDDTVGAGRAAVVYRLGCGVGGWQWWLAGVAGEEEVDCGN